MYWENQQQKLAEHSTDCEMDMDSWHSGVAAGVAAAGAAESAGAAAAESAGAAEAAAAAGEHTASENASGVVEMLDELG